LKLSPFIYELLSILDKPGLEEKTNVIDGVCYDKEIMNKGNILLFGVVISSILPLLSTPILQSQLDPQSINVLSGEVAPIGGEISYYSFSVPEEAGNPRLVGQYGVLNGQTIKVDVLDQEGCPTPLIPFDCISIYSAPERDHGNVDVGLKPGRTYYIEFKNNGFHSGPRKTHVDFYVQYHSNLFLNI
jgi:hypothetical protein